MRSAACFFSSSRKRYSLSGSYPPLPGRRLLPCLCLSKGAFGHPCSAGDVTIRILPNFSQSVDAASFARLSKFSFPVSVAPWSKIAHATVKFRPRLLFLCSPGSRRIFLFPSRCWDERNPRLDQPLPSPCFSATSLCSFSLNSGVFRARSLLEPPCVKQRLTPSLFAKGSLYTGRRIQNEREVKTYREQRPLCCAEWRGTGGVAYSNARLFFPSSCARPEARPHTWLAFADPV